MRTQLLETSNKRVKYKVWFETFPSILFETYKPIDELVAAFSGPEATESLARNAASIELARNNLRADRSLPPFMKLHLTMFVGCDKIEYIVAMEDSCRETRLTIEEIEIHNPECSILVNVFNKATLLHKVITEMGAKLNYTVREGYNLVITGPISGVPNHGLLVKKIHNCPTKVLGWDIKNKLPEGRKSSRLRNDQLALSLT